MPMSNFPNGFINGVTIRNVPITLLHPGKIIYVNNSSVLPEGGIAGSDTLDGTYLQPKSTINGALDACTASRGDIIVLMPGHAETISAAGGIALDVAGVAIVGLGQGDLRPTLTYSSAAAASMTVTAANCSIVNVVFKANYADVTQALNVTAKNLTLSHCEFKEAGADLNFLDAIHCSSTTNNNADGLALYNCKATAIDAAQNSLINIKADLDGLTVHDCYVNYDAAINIAMILCATGKDLTDCDIRRNVYLNISASGDLLIDSDTTDNTGVVAYNLIGHADTAGEVLIDADGVRQFENYGTAIDTGSGYLLPAVDS